MTIIGTYEAGATIAQFVRQFLEQQRLSAIYEIRQFKPTAPASDIADLMEHKSDFLFTVDLAIIQVSVSRPESLSFATGFLRAVLAPASMKKLLVISDANIETMWAEANYLEHDPRVYALQLAARRIMFATQLNESILHTFLS